jgi:HAD superfamily hydrolase (TIGR01458 family)
MKAILFDLDGVLYQANQAIDGARETLAWTRGSGIPHLFVTNTSSRPRSSIAAKLGGMGIVVASGELLTPPVAAAAWLKAHAPGPVAAFVPKPTRAEFEGLELLPEHAQAGAAAVVVGDMGSDWSYDRMNRAFRLLMDGDTRLVALGMTRYWQAEDGLRLDAGAIVTALSFAAGVAPVVLGKPDPAFFEAALARLGVTADQTLMVGDDVVGDIEGARRAGLKTALVRTGKFRPDDLKRGIEPDYTIDSIADLPALWASGHL